MKKVWKRLGIILESVRKDKLMEASEREKIIKHLTELLAFLQEYEKHFETKLIYYTYEVNPEEEDDLKEDFENIIDGLSNALTLINGYFSNRSKAEYHSVKKEVMNHIDSAYQSCENLYEIVIIDESKIDEPLSCFEEIEETLE